MQEHAPGGVKVSGGPERAAADSLAGVDIGNMNNSPKEGPGAAVQFSVPLKLAGAVQNYEWGRKGSESLVASFVANPDPLKPYAEYWVGAHPKAPSTVSGASGEIGLDRLIKENPAEVLGDSVVAKFGPGLPFLFKTLSVGSALSIQAHPDKALAEKLHAADSKNYPDDNHKPEIAIAITELELLYGFKPLPELSEIIKRNPELEDLAGSETVRALISPDRETAEGGLPRLYRAIVESDPERLGQLTARMVKRLSETDPCLLKPEEALAVDMHAIYGDRNIGIFSLLIMNYSKISPGQCVYMGPNVAHAYLYGEIIECMANSDNVVRAGLTPKFQDIPTLTAMLEYKPGPLKPIEAEELPADPGFRRYSAPVAEFCVDRLSTGQAFSRLYQNDGTLKLFFCLSGSASLSAAAGELEIKAGEAALIPAGVSEFTVSTRGCDLFRVGVPQN